MKTRVKIDSAILSFIIILTGLMYWFSQISGHNKFVDDIFDLLGIIIVLKGAFLRMAARGYKKAHSNAGQGLVQGGPYKFIRNPMYTGSFLIGAGFVLIAWPWWALPVFAALFFWRFMRQVAKEEKFLLSSFGQKYLDYANATPRFFPTIYDIVNVNFRELFPLKTIWDTKEKWGLLGWPILAFGLEIFQEKIVFGFTDMRTTAIIFFAGVFAFALATWIMYAITENPKSI